MGTLREPRRRKSRRGLPPVTTPPEFEVSATTRADRYFAPIGRSPSPFGPFAHWTGRGIIRLPPNSGAAMPDDHRPDPELTIPQLAPPNAPENTAVPAGTDTGCDLPVPRAPTNRSQTPDLPVVSGYVVAREIARGGMGVVYAAYDPTFDREVAIKVMHHGQDAERFLVESKITAQLPHPGVPPVHALGTLPDGCPFLAMKLIQGRTLAAELKTADLPRLLGTFEQICQTVGFAHSRGIIHRDLKPANVMVGAFGEVQVMDWGLARLVRDEGGMRDETKALPASSLIPLSSLETRPGQVKGTPAYMAPEQARGEPVGPPTDVFALGGILAVVLTGQAPFVGATVMDTVLMAAQADLESCFARLDACGADAELLALAKRCLAPRAEDRFPDGKAVAEAVAAYRAGVEERLRQAERDRAVSAAEAREQRKRRKVQLALVALVLLTAIGVGTGLWLQDRRESKRKADADREQARLEGQRDEAEKNKAEQAREGVPAGLELATNLRKRYEFDRAQDALAQVAKLAESGAPELLPGVEQARADLAFVIQLDDIRYRKWVWVPGAGGKGDFNTKIASPAYSAAFAARGWNLEALPPAEAAKRISASAIRAELVAAVDDWALYEPNEAVRNRLLEIARGADPGPWLNRLRDSAMWRDKAALAKLAAEADPDRTPPYAWSVLVTLMSLPGRGLDPPAMLSAARARHPKDFDLAFAVGRWHKNSKTGQAIGPYEAACALRPENLAVWVNLGIARAENGDPDGAITAFKQAIRLNPKFALAHTGLGAALHERGDRDAAIAALKEAIRLDPTYARAHSNLGIALAENGDPDGAVTAYKEAIKLEPTDADTHYNLGNVLFDKDDLDGAIAAYREARKLNPTDADIHHNLGNALADKGDADGAIAAYREAIKYNPKHADTHHNLGNVLFDKDDLDGAIAAYKEAIKHDPKHAEAHYGLGVALQEKGNIDDAMTAYEQAAALNPKHADAHYNLGILLSDRGDTAGAIAAYMRATVANPKHAQAHTRLGSVYFKQGKYTEALACARAAVKADPRGSHTHALLGMALRETGDLPGARAALTEAVRLDRKWVLEFAKLPPLDVAPPPRAVTRP